MVKKVETQLVISAKDLGTKKLRELAAAFRQVRQEQKDTANVTDRTTVKMDELRATLAQLAIIQKQVGDRRALVDSFRTLSEQTTRLAERLTKAKQALAEFRAGQDQGAKKTAEARQQLQALERSVKEAERAFASSENRVNKVSTEIKALGLDSKKAQQDLVRLGNTTERAFRQAVAAADALPRQQREYRNQLKASAAEEEAIAAQRKANIAEGQRRAAAEEASLKRQNALLAQQRAELTRIEQKRRDVAVAVARDRLTREQGVSSGFNTFSNNAAQIAASARLAKAQQQEAQAFLRTTDIGRRYQAVMDRNSQAASRKVGVLGRLSAAMRGYRTSLDQTTNAQRRYGESQRTALSITQRVRGQVLSLVSAYVGVFGVVNFATRAINASNERIGLQTRLLVGSADNAELAASEFRFLRSEADRLGFSLNDLGRVYSKLSIAGRAAGLETNQVREIFSNFAEVSRVNNLGVEETERVFRALEQILSKGKVQAEELRGQLGDVLPGAFGAFARSLGVSTAELDKALERGQVSSKALIGFSREYAKMVGNQVPRATKTLRAELGRLQTAFDDFLIVVSEEGLADAVSEVSLKFREFFKSQEGREAAVQIGAAFRAVADALLLVLQRLDLVIPLAKAFIAVLVGSTIRALAVNITSLAAAIAGMGTVATATTGALVGLRVALLTIVRFLGPIGFAIGAVATAFALFGDSAEDTAEKINPGIQAANELAEATRLAGNSAEEAVKSQDYYREALDKVRKAKEDLANAPQGDDTEAKKTREKAKADLERAEALLKVAEGVRDRNKALAEAREEALSKMRERNAELAIEAANRLEIARAVRLQRNEQLLLAKAFLGPSAAQGNGAAGLILAGLEKKARDARDAFREANIEREALYGGSRGPSSRGGRRGQKAEDPGNDLTEEVDKGTKKAAEARARLEEQAAALRVETYRESLRQQLEIDGTLLEKRIELINIEYDQRIQKARELQAELTAAGASTAANDLNLVIEQLDVQREIAKVEERRSYLQAQREESQKKSSEEIKAREEEIDRLIQERDAKLEAIDRRKSLGQLTDLEAVREAGETELAYKARIQQKIGELREFINGLDASLVKALGLDETLFKLEEIEMGLVTISAAQAKANELREQFAGGLADSFVAMGIGIANVIKGVGSFKDAISAAKDTFLNFAADFLIEIGKMILKQQLLNILQAMAKNGSDGGFFQTVANAIVGAAHTGGIIGTQAKTRSLPAAVFARAPRYHTGGMIGLGADEVPIVAKRGEEMLTEDDPRHRNNGGMARESIQIINAIDSASVVDQGLNSPAGTRTLLNVVKANKAAFKSMLG